MEYLWHGGKPSSGDQNTFHPPHLNNFKDVQTEHQLLTLQSLVVGPYSGKIIAFNFKLKFLGCQWSVSALTVHPHVTGVFTSFVGSCAFLHHPLCSEKPFPGLQNNLPVSCWILLPQWMHPGKALCRFWVVTPTSTGWNWFCWQNIWGLCLMGTRYWDFISYHTINSLEHMFYGDISSNLCWVTGVFKGCSLSACLQLSCKCSSERSGLVVNVSLGFCGCVCWCFLANRKLGEAAKSWIHSFLPSKPNKFTLQIRHTCVYFQ